MTPQASGSQSATSGSQDTSVSSSNWAGYATTGASGSLTSVSASWTQATANCVAGSQYGAFWVGLDGYASKTVEQIGTEADCTGPNPQTPKYYAWYEVFSGAGVNFTNPVSPGVTVNGKSMDTLNPVQITMPDTSVGDMATDGSFSVNYTGTGFAQWFGV